MSISGQKSGKAPERSNFAQTCSLLSKYMKEKRSYADLSAETTHQLPTADLLSSLENSPEIPKPDNGSQDSRKMMSNNGGGAQMTIFYGGQVMVFNEFPADKAKEIMTMACAKFNNNNKGNSPATGNNIPDLNMASTPSTPTSSSPQPPLQLPKSNIGSDLPIARRNSLHRFLEKRKDRSVMRAPYQINNNNNSPNHISKPEGSSSSSQLHELELFVQ